MEPEIPFCPHPWAVQFNISVSLHGISPFSLTLSLQLQQGKMTLILAEECPARSHPHQSPALQEKGMVLQSFGLGWRGVLIMHTAILLLHCKVGFVSL